MKKKKLFKTLPCLALSALMALSAPAMAFAGPSAGAAQGGWVSQNQKWWWRNPDGTWPASAWKEVNGLWYHFGPDGYVNLGWYQDADGTWYYLDPTNGDMKTGWAMVNGTWYYLDPAGGAMQTGWKNVGGYYYYLDSTGAMWHDTTTPDGYQVNHDGVWVEDQASSGNTANTASQSSGSSGEIKDGEDGWHKTSSGWYKDGMGGGNLSYYDEARKVLYMFNSSGYLDSYKMWDGGTSAAGYGAWIKATDPNAIYSQSAGNSGTSGSTSSKSSGKSSSKSSSKKSNSGYTFDDSADTEEMAEKLIKLVNKERKKKGRSTLETNDKLMEAAQIRAEEFYERSQEEGFDLKRDGHTRPDGTLGYTVFDDVGYKGRFMGEIAAIPSTNLQAAVDAWMASSAHKAIILTKNTKEAGAGIVVDQESGKAYCIMVFGK